MNISPEHCSRPDFLFAGFNQDCGCFAVGTKSGFRIFNTDPLRLKDGLHPGTPEGPGTSGVDGLDALAESGEALSSAPMSVIFAEMLFRCNYVAFVASDERKRVRIWDDTKKKTVIQLDFESEVKAVRLRRDRIVVVLQDVIQVFTFTSTPSCLHSFETCTNQRGLCSLSPSSSNSLLALPAKDPGKVQLVDLANAEKEPMLISAHEANLSCITINVQGTRLATASEKGTLIRLFSTENGQLLTELRRGTQPATIYSINFSSNSSLLCASSSHGTIHIFSVDNAKKNRQSSLASSAFLASNKLLPKYFSSEWSFVRIEVPGGTPCICAFGSTNNSVVAVCSDGSYHKFIFEDGSYSKDVYQIIFELEDKVK